MSATENKSIPVKVAVRIRPLVSREIHEGSQHFLQKTEGQPQIVIKGSNEAFTFDYVFEPNDEQDIIFNTSVEKLIHKIHDGFNITILAYGQTGSGKTYTMGTSEFSQGSDFNPKAGIIQRAVRQLFANLAEKDEFEYNVQVSFLELYKEKVFDLLSKNRGSEDAVDIREDPKLGIRVVGINEIPVSSWQDALSRLEQGSLNRKTGATAMNDKSSRSHAIFTISIQLVNKATQVSKYAKFHLVDLAGSERASKTQAVGERFAEGVNINKGLLALGNVIGALCESNGNRHIPYRDSKLTRLLQDSLGGNSYTLMVACVSPADSNYEETISTLRYADRARKIKNKPIVNIDPNAELLSLRNQVKQLQQQLLTANSGAAVNSHQPDDYEVLKKQLQISEEEKAALAKALQAALEENTNLCERAIIVENAHEELKQKLSQLQAHAEETICELNSTFVVSEDRPHLEGTALEKVRALASRISDVQRTQLQSEKELLQHTLLQQTERQTDGQTADNEEEMPEAEAEDPEAMKRRHSKMGADLALRQAALSDNLKDLNKQLLLKLQMVETMTAQQEPLAKAKIEYEAAVAELEKQISVLQREKEELANILQTTTASQNVCKLSEQRRKRLQELESLIADLKKKIQEQANVIKMKERAEEQVKKFNVEIQNLKSNRVKLIRQIREENEKFRRWQMQKDREMAKLKAQDRKREGQLKKMEQLHTKQQHVLRRKMEEAVAVNKRLKEALSLQGGKKQKLSTAASVTETEARIASWLESELELVTSTRMAESALKELSEGRATLTSKKEKLQAKLERLDKSSAQYNGLLNEIANIEADIQQRSEQIVDLKQKISDADLETRSKTRLDYIQVMVEAKVAVRCLFDSCAEARVETSLHKSELTESRAEMAELIKKYEEIVSNLDAADQELEQMKQAHQSELNKLSIQYETKIVALMKQLPSCGKKDSTFSASVEMEDLLERLHVQQEEIARCAQLREQLATALAEVESLKNQNGSRNNSVNSRRRKERLPTARFTIDEFLSPSTVSDEASDSEADDPDWHKTPLFRRIKKLREESQAAAALKESTADNTKGRKRNSRSHCACKTGKCKQCVCAKALRPCTSDCACFSVGCCSAATASSSSTALNGTYDVEGTSSSSTSRDNTISEDPFGEENAPPKKRSRELFGKKRSYFNAVKEL